MPPSASPTSARVRLVIVGHVDHGKSTLIGRLLYDTDSLPEAVVERLRQISGGSDKDLSFEFVTDHLGEERLQARTIDTTQVFFRHAGRSYVIIDTPGHAEFIKNMFTGASRADAALLVVDAAEGLREQTLAHCNVLSMLGIEQVVPVVNKMDQVDYAREPFQRVADEVARMLGELRISPRPAVPISARAGDNVAARAERMPWYDGPSLLQTLETISGPASLVDQPLRFPIQDVYDVGGKRIYVGRVESGALHAPMPVQLVPGPKDNTIVTVEVFGQDRRSARAGESVGITLAEPIESPRGLVVCEPGRLPAVASELTGGLFWLSKEPLLAEESLRVRIVTGEVQARVADISRCLGAFGLQRVDDGGRAACLGYGEAGWVRLVTGGPLVREPFDSGSALGTFALARDGNVVGAGTVIT